MIRVATYNVHRSVGRDGLENPQRIAQVIEEVNPDVLALQEVAYRRGEPGHLLELARDTTNGDVVEGMTLEDRRGYYGNALVSRLPVREVHHVNISVPRREPRGAIDAILDTGGPTLQVVATHLGLRPRERRHQVQALLRAFDASNASTKVLLGDLNEWFLLGRPIRWLQRVFDETRTLPTFPSRRPFLALDRCWVSPSASLLDLYVHDSKLARMASDHLPLVAELRP